MSNIKVYDDEETFIMAGRKWKATGKQIEGGFVVEAGSTVNSVCEFFKKMKPYYQLRTNLEQNGVIKDNAFKLDYKFDSAYQAGCIVAARTLGGRTVWKTAPDKDGAVLTFREAHPKPRHSGKAKRADRSARLDEVQYESEATIDGRKWHNEWRGRAPIRRNGIYSGVRCA